MQGICSLKEFIERKSIKNKLTQFFLFLSICFITVLSDIYPDFNNIENITDIFFEVLFGNYTFLELIIKNLIYTL